MDAFIFAKRIRNPAAILAAAQNSTGHDQPFARNAASGAAHIGVLQVLEELRVPIDCVAGTSMGLPGAFVPVQLDGKVLADGGVTRNLPIDVARNHCADIVIAVWMSSPAPTPVGVASALAVLNRSIDVMINANQIAQIATLTAADIDIDVPVGDLGTGDIRTFPGLRTGELRGNSYWTLGSIYKWRLADLQPLLGHALYAGMRFQIGEVGERFDRVEDGALIGISGSISGKTAVGAFILSLGYVDNGSLQLQFTLGQPVDKGSLPDAIR